MIKAIIAELQNEKTMKKIESNVLTPMVSYMLRLIAPYFVMLCTLLVLIIILLITVIYRHR